MSTPDGTEIRLCASVGGTEGARRAMAMGAASIGLVRSEICSLPILAGRPRSSTGAPFRTCWT